MSCASLNTEINNLKFAIRNDNIDGWQGVAKAGGGLIGMLGLIVAAPESFGASLTGMGVATTVWASGLSDMHQALEKMEFHEDQLDELCKEWNDAGCTGNE